MHQCPMCKLTPVVLSDEELGCWLVTCLCVRKAHCCAGHGSQTEALICWNIFARQSHWLYGLVDSQI